MKIFNDIITEFFKIPLDQIKDSVTSKDIPEWDSMNYLLFIAELEKEYNVHFEINEVLEVESIGSIKKLLQSKGVNV